MRIAISAVVLAAMSVLGIFASGSANAQGAVVAHDWNGRVFSAHADVRTGEVLTFQGVSHVVVWTNSLPAAGETTFGISSPFVPANFNGKTVVFSG